MKTMKRKMEGSLNLKSILNAKEASVMRRTIIISMVAVLAVLFVGTNAYAGETLRVSVDTNGLQADSQSYFQRMSADGNHIIFASQADNLVSGDTNRQDDVFVHDILTGETMRASEDSFGVEGNSYSIQPAINADGTIAAFSSWASNLVENDRNYNRDVFVKDDLTAWTERVNVDNMGNESSGYAFSPSVSDDGRFVAFASQASDLVAGDLNGVNDIFVYDRLTGGVELASVSSNGEQGNNHSMDPVISGDGRYVAFASWASNLVTNDNNGIYDIFVYDRVNGTTERVSVSTNGLEANRQSYMASISSDGRYVAFLSHATNLVPGDVNSAKDAFVRDRLTGTTSLVSLNDMGQQGWRGTFSAMISGNGRYVAFAADSENMVTGDVNYAADVFVRDLVAGTTYLVSVTDNGTQADNWSGNVSINYDGSRVGFISYADNLVGGDTNGVLDVFIHDGDYFVPEVAEQYTSVSALEAVEATVVINPDTLNRKSHGGSNSVTVYIEVPGYDLEDVNLDSITLSSDYGVITGDPAHTAIGDYDHDGEPDLMIKFDRNELISIVEQGINTLQVSGSMGSEDFAGMDDIKVIH